MLIDWWRSTDQNGINNNSNVWRLSEIKLPCPAYRWDQAGHELHHSGHDFLCVLCRAGNNDGPQLLFFAFLNWWDKLICVHGTPACSEIDVKYEKSGKFYQSYTELISNCECTLVAQVAWAIPGLMKEVTFYMTVQCWQMNPSLFGH